MRPRSDRCEPERLRLLAEDRLPAAELTDLETHLRHCERCQETLDFRAGSDHWLEEARHYLADEASEADERVETLGFLAPTDWPDSIGRIGTYEVKGVLGRGGMGVVLKAFDPALNRNVAIKVMAAPLAIHGASRRRFLREARACAAVVHEHVVAVHAVEEAAGLPYLVMEYVPGRSLQERLDRDGSLALTEILRIGMQTASGLAAAHAQGVVHRDVKPANILLENGVERVRLTDFGLARAADDATLTHSGTVAGTPYYMAPEQARGEATDHRADLFSLGSTLYALCAGHPPFRADSALAVLRRVTDETPRSLREINPDVPVWLESIVALLMAKEPAERYQTADEVADLLARCLAHVQQPLAVVLPEDLPATKVLRSRTPGRRWLTAAGLVGGAALLTGALALLPSEWPGADVAPRRQKPARDSESFGSKVESSAEVDRRIDQVRGQIGAVEADLLRREDTVRPDPVSQQLRSLTSQAQALEKSLNPSPTR